MKNYARNALIALLAMFILLILRSANAAGPFINLPSGTVDATFNYPGPVSYWKITLSSVPSGYDVTNGIYVSWCCDQTHTISNGAKLSVNLYSSYDPLQPYRGGDPGWNKVNYIINNKQGTADDVQAAIWHYIDANGGNQADPDVIAMKAAADAHPDFVPLPGQLVAVVVYKAGSQVTFIEVIVPAHTYTITVTQTSNGTITPGTTVVNYGGNQTFNITANAGYRIVDVVVDGTEHLGAVTSYSFTNVQADHIIMASFAPMPLGGEWVPIDKLQLLAPGATMISLMTVATVFIGYLRRRKK